MRWNATLAIVYINVALYALCFQLQRPIEPFLVDKLSQGADSQEAFGQLGSFFSVIQTIGSPVVGVLVDRIGPKHSFMFVFAGSALSYGILSCATSMSMLYLSKLPALLQHAFLVAQTIVSVVVVEAERAEALGLLMTSYTVGATIGPFVGGVLGASGDYYLGARLAAAGSVLSVVLTMFIPAPEGPAQRKQEKHQQRSVSESLQAVLRNPVVLCVLVTKVASSVANSITQTARPLILKNQFGLLEAGIGFTMSAGMAANAVGGATLVGWMTNRLSPSNVVACCLLGCSLLHVCSAVTVHGDTGLLVTSQLSSILPGTELHHSGPFVASSVLGGLLAFVMATVLTSVSTSAVPAELRGSLMGVEHAMFSLARVGTPALSVRILTQYGAETVSGICAMLVFGVWLGWQLYASKRLQSLKSAQSKDCKAQ